MTTLMRALSAEQLKLKRSLAWWLVLIGPLSMVALAALMYLQRPSSAMWSEFAGNPWMAIATNAIGAWGMLFVLLFIALQTALMGSIEHNAQSWKHLFALPVPRWTTYVAKQIVALAMIGVSNVVLLAGVVAAGLLLRTLNIHPEYSFDVPVDWGMLIQAMLLSYVGSWLIIAIHTWIAVRWRSFAIASVVGIVATIFALFALNNDLGWYYPWAMPGAATFSILDPEQSTTLLPVTLALSVVGSILVTLFGTWNISRRDVL